MGRCLGQVSAEMLTVFFVFLILLSISVTAIEYVGKASKEKAKKAEFSALFQEFRSKADSACRLGPGNVRHMQIPYGTASVFSNGDELGFSWEGSSQSFHLPCNYEISLPGPIREIAIANKEGTIEISSIEQE